MAGHGARRDHHDRRGAAAGAALPARDGRPPAARPVRLLRRRRRGRVRQGGRPGQPRAGQDRPRRLGQQPADARPALAAQGPAAARRRTRAASATAAGSGSRAGSTSSTGSTARALLPAIVLHLQPGRLRRRGHRSASAPDVRLTTPEERDEIYEFVEERCRDLARRRPARARLPRLPRRADPRRRRPPRRDAAGVQGVRRGAVRPRPVQGRVRDRDAGARHQHAGPHGRDREARASGTARPTPTSRRGSTPSSPAGPAAAASTSRATASCCGSPA